MNIKVCCKEGEKNGVNIVCLCLLKIIWQRLLAIYWPPDWPSIGQIRAATENLIEKGIYAEGKDKHEANMILNHKRTIR